MDRSKLHCIFSWFVILQWTEASYASPLFLNQSVEGSGCCEDGRSELVPSPSIISSVPSPTQGTEMEQVLLAKMIDFLRENLFLILVITCLLLVIFLIVCSAAVLSQRRKVNAYYPCSFPTKMYVDVSDKTGGGQVFRSFPEILSSGSIKEPVSSAKQLQDVIITATKKLRTPTKAPWRETEDQKPAEWEGSPETKGEMEEIPQQPANKEAKEEVSAITCQDAAAVCHVEKSDPSSPDLLSDSQHPSGSDGLEAQEETDKQEAAAFIREEKTAF